MQGKQLEISNNSFIESYTRTLNNCKFYEKEGKYWSLMNEIGVLRGLMYGMEMVSICSGYDFDVSEAEYYMELQVKLKEKDEL